MDSTQLLVTIGSALLSGAFSAGLAYGIFREKLSSLKDEFTSYRSISERALDMASQAATAHADLLKDRVHVLETNCARHQEFAGRVAQFMERSGTK